MKLDRLVVFADRFLKLPGLLLLIKKMSLAHMTFAELLKVSSTKAQVLYTAYSKAKLFPENLSNNSDLDDSRISLPAFSYLESI